VSASETLEAIAVETGYSNSPVASAAYTITVAVPAPTFSPAAGTYTTAQTVSISDTTVGTTIYYTTNGATPTTSSTVYTGPIPVNSTETLEAIAVETGDSNAVGTAIYTIATVLPTPTFSVAAGTYTTSQTVAISDSTAGTTIYYTTNGTAPTTSSTKYTAAVTVGANETLEAIAVETSYTNSLAASAAYTIATVLPTSTFSVAAGTYATSQTVAMSDSTAGTTIYYTTNGTAPTTSSTKYTGAVTVSATETLNAIAIETGYTNSLAASAAYTITVAVPAPTFSPAAGTYTTAQTVAISESTAGTTIYYTTNGTTPTTSSTVYSGPITVSASEAIEAIAFETGDSNAVGTAIYTIALVLPTPTFNVAAGTYTAPQTVTISDATAGTTIYYTTNGTTPTTSSSAYSGSITVSTSETIESIAVETGHTNSLVATVLYTINSGSTPYISYSSGGFTSASLKLNGGATVTSGGLLQLTDGGVNEGRTAWFPTEVPVQTFVTDFTFQQLNSNADGMTFTIQGQGATALGGTGASLGYQGINDSVAVKFDLYSNSGEGPDSTGLYTDGASPTVPAVNLSTTGINLHSGDIMHAHMVYDGTNLTMTLTDTVTSAFVTEVFPVNIPSLVGGNTAWVGFTGGTGGKTSTQNVLTWSYAEAPPAGAPAFSLAAGAYTTAQSVTISDATAGTTIYYTVNGTTPTTSSSLYSGPLTVSASETIEAIAVEAGYSNSAVGTAAYTISSGNATYISYPSGGFTSASLDLNGGATATSGGLLQLTDGGAGEQRSAWFATEVPVQSFVTDFTFQQLNASADGMTFAIQSQGSTALGGTGGSLGYQGINDSVAVKFDLFSNSGEGTDSTGLYTEGAPPTVPAVDLSATGINLHSGDIMHAHMVYDGTNLTMTLTDTVTSAFVTEVFPVNIPSMVGGNTAWVGFTGGTGGSTATQNVLTWSYVAP
jgi:hypothetical protein